MKTKKLLVLLCILVAGAIFNLGYQPLATTENSIEDLVRRTRDISGWSFIRDIELDYKKHTALDPNALIFRDYRNANGEVVNLTVVYHQNDRWGAHDPAVCYKSQGWEITPIAEKPTLDVDGRRLELSGFTVRKANYSSLVYYFWFSSRDRLMGSRTRQMIEMALSGLIHGYTESGFVRFSIGYSPSAPGRQPEVLKGFVKDFIRVLQSG